MPSPIRSKISGTGLAVPKYCLTNEELSKIVDTSDEWITTRTGIKKRYLAKDGETCVTLAAEAAREALKRAQLKPTDIDMIIFGTITPNRHMPSAACDLGYMLGTGDAAAFDLAAACSGFIYSVSIADQFIRCGTKKNVLCIGAEVLSSYVNWNDRTTCVIFGDGAGAAVVSATQDDTGSLVVSHHIYSDGSKGDLLCIPGGGSRLSPSNKQFKTEDATIQMQGRELYKHAVNSMIYAAEVALKENNLTINDIDLFIPHQANSRIIETVAEKMNVPLNKVMINVADYGNTSAGTIPIALHEAILQGRCKKGDLVLMNSFGGGLTYGSLLIRV